ncbi:DUF3854 domain-containing protein [Verrucomicrobiales bacterium]|nr:DUF3854 domain-containing protein [bacterium]MDA7673076.1 DUF3854 domain-containing protein [Verrucomicrobiales bacterium]MDB4617413.1 DUF3854 domain-containing protein [Verrucomicrobiales bacterium]MDB4657840.1 DUF3854 domain-containing protein [Verrucomicrobiales bacterium]MDC0275314.1 DUF3854 domain-containing protein [Verrucomicrobiales bacterium]
MTNSINNSAEQNAPPAISDFDLAGISEELIKSAKLEVATQPNASGEYGLKEEGVLFPYFTAYGDPVHDDGYDFARIRLLRSRGDQKYSQRRNTGAHSYLTLWILGHERNGCLYLIEGEKKALALASEGLAAVGLPGFYGYRSNGFLTPD